VTVEYFQEESSCNRRLRPRVGLKENRMSRRNGNRSRFDRQRRAKIHNRTRIRELRKTDKSLDAPETTKKNTIESSDRRA
jgi:hypothetical protein